ncbi:hypothetical protein CYLTODRAFT_478928, partial [Cylindrobasidium torrendii FP15055 ss-10]
RRDGLTRLELDKRWISARTGKRCTSSGFQTQRQKQRVAPAATAKYEGHMDWALRAYQRVLEMFIKIGVDSLKAYNPTAYEILKNNADIKNIPALGSHDNCAFLSVQINMASAVKYESSEFNTRLRLHKYELLSGEGLVGEMSESGTEHFDKSDARAGYTCMIASPFLNGHVNYEPGRFHLLELGFYVILSATLAVLFQGLRYHAGTPARAPPGEEVDPNVTRFVVVLYPPSTALEGNASFTMCAGPRNEPILSVPDAEDYGHCLSVKNANIAQDGPAIMQHISVITVLVRFVIQFMVMMLRQLPIEYNLKIDTDKILEAVSFDEEIKDKDGSIIVRRRTLDPWPNAPPIYGHRKDEYAEMGKCIFELSTHYLSGNSNG